MAATKRRTAQHAAVVALLEQIILPQTRASNATKLVRQSITSIAPDWSLLQHFRCSHCSSSAGEICDGWVAAASEAITASHRDTHRPKSGACICGILCCEDSSEKAELLCRSGTRGPCGGRVHAACNDTLRDLVGAANGCDGDSEVKGMCNFCALLFETSTRHAVGTPGSTKAKAGERALSLKERRAEDAQMQSDLEVRFKCVPACQLHIPRPNFL